MRIGRLLGCRTRGLVVAMTALALLGPASLGCSKGSTDRVRAKLAALYATAPEMGEIDIEGDLDVATARLAAFRKQIDMFNASVMRAMEADAELKAFLEELAKTIAEEDGESDPSAAELNYWSPLVRMAIEKQLGASLDDPVEERAAPPSGAGGDRPSLAGKWVLGEAGMTLDFQEDGTFAAPETAGAQKCREAGFADAVDECSSGRWSATGDGYLVELPGLDIGETTTSDGTAGKKITCRCGGRKGFPATLSGDTLSLDMSDIGRPAVRLRRAPPGP